MDKTETDGSKGAWVETEKGNPVWVSFDEIIITLVPSENDLPTRDHNACVQRMPVSYEHHIVDDDICDAKFRKTKAKGKRERGFVVRKETDPLQRIVPWFQACVRWLLDNKVCTRINCDDPQNVNKKERRNIVAREGRAQISAVAQSVLFGSGFDLLVSVGKSSQVLHCYTAQNITRFEASLRKAIMETTKVKGLVEQQERELNPDVNEAINDDEEWWSNAMMGFMQGDDSDDGEEDGAPSVQDPPSRGKFAHVAKLLRENLEQNKDDNREAPSVTANTIFLPPATNPSITRTVGKPSVPPTISRAAQEQLPDWRRRGPAAATQRAAPLTKGNSTAKTSQTAGQTILRQLQGGSQGGALPSRPKDNPWNLHKDSDEEAIQVAKAASLKETKEHDPREWDENDPWRPQDPESIQEISTSGREPLTEASRTAQTASSRGWKPSLPASAQVHAPREGQEAQRHDDDCGGWWDEDRRAPREDSVNGWVSHANPWRGYHNWKSAGWGSSSSAWNADSGWATSTWGEWKQTTTSRSKAKGASTSYY